MSISTIPAAKAGLIARLQADANLGVAGIAVTYGLPAAPNRALPREWVFVGNSKSDDPTHGTSGYGGGQQSATLGRQAREERYVLELVVSVVQGSLESQQPVTERAFAIAGYIENSIRAWSGTTPNPFDGVARWALVTSLYHQEGVMKSGDRLCNIFLDVAFSARI